MNAIHTQASEVKAIVNAAFPEFSGRHITVEPFTGPLTMHSYWSGCQRDYWAIVDMRTMRASQIPENGTPWTNPEGFGTSVLPENTAIVRFSHGYTKSACVYVNQCNLSKLLPAPMELTRDQKIVLAATSSYKSSYAGIKDYRFKEAHEITGIDRLSWDQAKAELITRSLLNRAGAITDAGRNAIGRTDLYSLKPTAQIQMA